MRTEPEYSESAANEHADGVHEGAEMKYSSYCLDCFNIVDRMIDEMLNDYIP